MSDPENPVQTDSAHRALKALREGDPEVTAKALLEALKDDPNRLVGMLRGDQATPALCAVNHPSYLRQRAHPRQSFQSRR